MFRPLLRFCLFAVLLLATGAAASPERILAYHSDIEVKRNGAMVVTETLQVVAAGQRIRQGIFRDFPTDYKDHHGNRYQVDFDVLEVLRDGIAEKWHTKKMANGVRIYIGEKGVFLPSGVYTYSIRYYTDRQLGFFNERDELYWNVTGNGWDFAIEQASARVLLPAQVPAEKLGMSGYTGPQGSRAQRYQSSVAAGEGSIATTGRLGPREGLTLVFDWPKGIVNEPGYARRAMGLLGDNLGLLLALLVLLGSSLYLLKQWHRHGRDPEEGVVFPRYEPPAGHSPASLRYVRRMGYDNKTFTAAVINLAVKGHLAIECDKRLFGLREHYTLRQQSSQQSLSPGEQEVLRELFREGDTLALENGNHRIVSGARTAHEDALAKAYHDRYFSTNLGLIAPTAVIAFLALLLFLSSGMFVLWILPIYALVVIVHVLFAWLLKAPSAQGRDLMDAASGFQMYLEVAEKDELHMRNPPDLTPRLFETYLPFAIALGVEQAWAEQFAEVFASLRVTDHGSHYQPGWYRGEFDPGGITRFSGAVASGLNAAISSAAQAPGSSSGSGGGGSSGGGGGGGGGGGW